MIDVNTFLLMILYFLGSILLGVLIVLSVKLIGIVDRCNKVLDDVEGKLAKFDRIFSVVDIVTDNVALISDKIIDGVSNVIRKFMHNKINRKEDELSGE